MTSSKLFLGAALAGLMAAGVAVSANAEEGAAKEMEKCYGIAEAGKNDCAAADGSHACAGHATAAKSGKEFKLVAKGECEKAGGKLEAF